MAAVDLNIAKVPEVIKSVVQALPVRRSQFSNWAIRLMKINQPFIGKFMGFPMEIHPMEAASRSAYFLGFYEREVTLWAIDYFRKEKPKVIIDIGANFGYFMYLAFSELHNSTIIAFEPDPYNLQWLQKNLALFYTPNTINIESLAVSDSPGTVRFIPSVPGDHQNLWAGMSMGKNASNEIEVKSISLDDYCDEKKISLVDLVKMDIEGAEGFAIDGMLRGIKKQAYKNVLVELHPKFLTGKHTPQSIITTFLSQGYSCYHFVSPFSDHGNNDKKMGFYDTQWNPSYLKKVDEKTINLNLWEHVLFSTN